MATYTNMGHGMATVIFTDGDGLILKRGERREDSRTVVWIDKGVTVNNKQPMVAPIPAETSTDANKNKKEDKGKVLNKE